MFSECGGHLRSYIPYPKPDFGAKQKCYPTKDPMAYSRRDIKKYPNTKMKLRRFRVKEPCHFRKRFSRKMQPGTSFETSVLASKMYCGCPSSWGAFLTFRFGRANRRASAEAVVVLAETEGQQICAFGGVVGYIPAPLSVSGGTWAWATCSL